MNGSPELLEFYLVEATEYIDALDQLVAPGQTLLDTNALLATARALRGSSTMAKVEPISELSLVLEQIAIKGRDPEFVWSKDLHEALRGCVDDLRFLVRGVRVWSDREQSRAEARVADLRRFIPADSRRPTPPTTESTTPVFVALQTAAIAAELDAFVATPTHKRALDDAIGRTRTLRGIAGIGDFTPLSDVAEGVERAARKLMPDAPLTSEEIELFRAAAALFRRCAEQLRGTGRHVPPTEESERFARAAAALDAPPKTTPPVVRIDQLFYADQGPHVIERAAAPSVSADERLHRELVARAEHLRRLVSEARSASDPVVAARVRRELRTTTRELETLAASFGAHQLSAFFAESGEQSDLLSAVELDVLESAGRITERPFPTLDELERRIAVVQRARHTPRSTPTVAPPVAPAAAAATTTPAATPVSASATRRQATPTGRDLQDLLTTGLEGLKPLDTQPLSEPVDVGAREVVPIDSLLFRGSSALSRAIELRDEWRSRGAPEEDSLREIFDLLDLAKAE
ncbi:MAG: Hpt domain-containing protein [Gemmatimonadaceae bacterium]